MSSATENPSEAAERLEHALERIALAMATSIRHQDGMQTAAVSADATREAEAVKARLDALIGKLRAGLVERTR